MITHRADGSCRPMNAHSNAATASGRQERAAITAPTLVSSRACVPGRSESAFRTSACLAFHLDVCIHAHSKGRRVDRERLDDNDCV